VKGVRVTDTDKGWKDLMRRLFKDGGNVAIEVGVFGPNADKPHEGAGAQRLTVLQVGIFNEFGLGVPERSFIRSYFDENAARLQKAAAKLMVSVIDGKRTRAQALDVLGTLMVGEIQKRIAAGIAPPNAPSTVARKGSSTPLINSGQLRASVAYRVVPA
jgi:hypothetical protein